MLRLKQNYILIKFENSKRFDKIHIILCFSSLIVIQYVRRWHPNNWMYHSTCWSYESLLFRFLSLILFQICETHCSSYKILSKIVQLFSCSSDIGILYTICIHQFNLKYSDTILCSFHFHFEVIFVQYRLIITDRNMTKSLNVKIISNRPANTISP